MRTFVSANGTPGLWSHDSINGAAVVASPREAPLQLRDPGSIAIAVSLIAIAVSLIAIAVSLIAVAVTVSVSGPAVIIIPVGVTIAVAVVVVRIISVRGIPVEERITKIAKEDELIAGRSVMAPIATPIPATPIPATPIPATPIPATPIPATPIPATGCRSASGERL